MGSCLLCTFRNCKMSQRSLFSYFTAKNPTTPASSPVMKKQTAIRSLKKISSKAKDSSSDFELENTESESEDEKEFKKVASEEKIMKLNKPSSSEYESESEQNFIDDDSDEEQKTPSKSRTRAKPAKSTKSRSIKTTKAAVPFDAPPEVNHAQIAREASASVSEEDLPDWLTTKLRDKNKKRPDEEGYDPSTVYIPETVKETFTPFQKQFWDIKENNFDAIVMIRKGKFYEMFSVDAIFARDVLKLHLTYRGKEPMCGVPEKAFSEWAIKIINAGKRVCKVEQMETAIDQANRKGKGAEKAIQRKLVQVYSLGTIDDFEMLESSQPSYLLSIRSSSRQTAGVCLVDCSTGTFHLGAVNEDDLADTLIRFEPVEVIYSANNISPEHLAIIKHYCGNVATRAKTGSETWDSTLAMNTILKIAKWDNVPDSLENVHQDAIAALGGCVAYLNEHKIAESLLSLKRFKTLDEAGSSSFLSLDSSALTNLQIIGKDPHCLINILDHCTTPFGRRRLRFWIMHPLRSINQIEERQKAVEELMKPDFNTLSKELKTIPDLERMLSRVYSNKCSVKVFIDCLGALKKCCQFFTKIEGTVKSPLLANVVPPGKGKSLAKQIDDILAELEVEKSIQSNEFIVKKGVFKDIDDIDEEVSSIEDDLNDILRDIKREVGCKDLSYVNMQSEKFQVQIPVKYCSDLPDKYILMSQTKSVRRYHTPEIKEKLKQLDIVENERQKLRSGSQKRFIDEFAKNSPIWDSIVDAIADIDCLISLAMTSIRWRASGVLCKPIFVQKDSPEAHGQAILQVEKMNHPCIIGTPIPNDIDIHDRFVLLITGPNASGKSTYARMCCVSIILAQIGCMLPAVSAKMTCYDQIFTRIGASDRIFNGQSTFAVESSETARLMKHATSDSFVVLDELGRGTSTLDGIAIASSVLDFFINKVKCPLVFCTHYHVLAEEFEQFPMVRNASMKYEISNGNLTLAYTLIDKMCPSSFGCRVAKICGLPADLTEEAQKVADDFEDRHAALRTSGIDVKVETIEERRDIIDLKKAIDDLTGGVVNEQNFYKFMDFLSKELPKINVE